MHWLRQRVAVGIAKQLLHGVALLATARGPNPWSKHTLCLLAMDDHRGYLS